MTQRPERILVVGPAWVGDMVMAQSLFMTLKQQNENCLVDVIAPAWSVPILQRMPQVNDAIELPVGHKQLGLAARYRIGKSLRNKHYDRAIVTPRSFKSALKNKRSVFLGLGLNKAGNSNSEFLRQPASRS